MVRAICNVRKTPATPIAPDLPDRRRGGDPRIPWDPTLVRIAVEGEFIPVQAQVVDVSEFGLGLQVAKPYPLLVGMEITIEMYSVLITGSIRYRTRKRDVEPFRIGVLITGINRLSA